MDDAKKLLLLKEHLQEHERTVSDRPRLRATSTVLSESIQNEVTIRGGKSKAKKPRNAKVNKAIEETKGGGQQLGRHK